MTETRCTCVVCGNDSAERARLSEPAPLDLRDLWLRFLAWEEKAPENGLKAAHIHGARVFIEWLETRAALQAEPKPSYQYGSRRHEPDTADCSYECESGIDPCVLHQAEPKP